MDEYIPKVFISYSWAVKDRVLKLANSLCSDGIDVKIDVWDLKEGHNTYTFMEQCVGDPTIDKVLIICDKTYMEKANSMKGGVGTETQIISVEVYGKTTQEKFIPVIFEVDENKKPYLPIYLKPILYINLSQDDCYETEYGKLLRNLYNKPLYTKPSLGKIPEWLENDTIDMSNISNGSTENTTNQSGISKATKYSTVEEIIFKTSFSEIDALLFKYMIDNNVFTLGDRWMANSQVEHIQKWEEINNLNNLLSENYDNALRKLQINNLIDICSTTSHGNTREWIFKKPYIDQLFNLNHDANAILQNALLKNNKSKL